LIRARCTAQKTALMGSSTDSESCFHLPQRRPARSAKSRNGQYTSKPRAGLNRMPARPGRKLLLGGIARYPRTSLKTQRFQAITADAQAIGGRTKAANARIGVRRRRRVKTTAQASIPSLILTATARPVHSPANARNLAD